MKRKLITLTLALILSLLVPRHVFGSFQTSELPSVLMAVAPPYPAVAATARLSGTVILEVKINSEGKVTSVNLVEGNPSLGRAAEVFARRWVFSSASNFSATRSTRLTFDFKLMPNETPVEEMQPIFMPPYKVEVRGKVLFVNDTTVNGRSSKSRKQR
jgi:TonB family protein